MWALDVTRSTIAAIRRRPGETLHHPLIRAARRIAAARVIVEWSFCLRVNSDSRASPGSVGKR